MEKVDVEPNIPTIELKPEKPRRKPPPPGLKDDLTVIAHICVVFYFILICYLCFVRPFEFFTWHPLLLSLGWMLLMTEGILIISKENPVVRKLRLNHTWKLRYHWIILSIALLLVFIGFLIAVVNKNRLNKKHFKSWHALFGLISLVACIPAVINGTAALFDVELKKYIKPSIIKLIHQASGTIAFLFGGLAVVLSVYTKWFAKSSNNNKYLFLLGLATTLYSVIWTLQRPLLKCFRKLFKL
nr:cytochrome b561 domain-containing protein 2-like [Leptinotarsa decemlineata]